MLFITKAKQHVDVCDCVGAKLTPSWVAQCVAREIQSCKEYKHVRTVRTTFGYEVYGLKLPPYETQSVKEFIVSITKTGEIDEIGKRIYEDNIIKGREYAKDHASPSDVSRAIKARMRELGAEDIAPRVYVAGPGVKDTIVGDCVLANLCEIHPVPVSVEVAADLVWEKLREDFEAIMTEHDGNNDDSLASKLNRLKDVTAWYGRVQTFVGQGLDMIEKVKKLKEELPNDDVLDYVLSIGSEA